MTVDTWWNMLSQEVVEAPALDMFKTHLDKTTDKLSSTVLSSDWFETDYFQGLLLITLYGLLTAPGRATCQNFLCLSFLPVQFMTWIK